MAMSMQQTKTRIKSVASTKKITKAMELVATAKLKKAKDINNNYNPFKDEVFEIISYCAENITDKDYKYFKENETDKTLYIVVNSSLGLCGGYNMAIEKYVLSNISTNDDLLTIGSKATSYYQEKGYNIIEKYPELPGLNLKENLSTFVARNVLNDFLSKKYRSIKMVYTRFINSLTFEPECLTLLPLTNIVSTAKLNKELLLEPTPEEVLDNLIPFYLTTAIKSLLFESILSEQASRRTAMENATDNASELEDKLRLDFNKSRQASITQEITEISSAANASR